MQEEQARILLTEYLFKRPERDFYTFMEIHRSCESCAKAVEILNRLSSTIGLATPSRVRLPTDYPVNFRHRISLHFGSEFSDLVARYSRNLVATAKADLQAELRVYCTEEESHASADGASSNQALVLRQRNSVLLILHGITVSEFRERGCYLLDILSAFFSVSRNQIEIRKTGPDNSAYVVIEIPVEAVLSLIMLFGDRDRQSVLKADFHRLLPEVSSVVFHVGSWPSWRIVIEVSAHNSFLILS